MFVTSGGERIIWSSGFVRSVVAQVGNGPCGGTLAKGGRKVRRKVEREVREEEKSVVLNFLSLVSTLVKQREHTK